MQARLGGDRPVQDCLPLSKVCAPAAAPTAVPVQENGPHCLQGPCAGLTTCNASHLHVYAMPSSYKPCRADSGIQPFKALFEPAGPAKRPSLEDTPAGKRAKMMSDGTTAGKVSGSQLARELRDKAERERQARAAEDKGATGQGAVTVRRLCISTPCCCAHCVLQGLQRPCGCNSETPTDGLHGLGFHLWHTSPELAQFWRTGAGGAGPCLHLGCTVLILHS